METIAIYPGRFHPFHKGHAESFKQLAKEFGLNNTYLAISAKQEQPKSPFSAEDREKMAMALGIPKNNIISVSNPYNASEYIERFSNAGIDPEETILVFGVSAKDMETDPRFSFKPKKDGSKSYMQPYSKGPQEPMTKGTPGSGHAYIATTDVADFPIAGESMRDASAIRNAYINGDDNKRMQILTDLYGDKASALKPIFDANLQPVTESIKHLISKIKPMLGEATVEQKAQFVRLLENAKRIMSNQSKPKTVVTEDTDYLEEK